MSNEQKRKNASEVLARIATDDGIRILTEILPDMKPDEIKETLNFASCALSPSRDDHKREYTLYIDGSSIGNPGPAGIAAIIEDGNGNIVEKASKHLGITTNNVAEYSALIMGLETVRDMGAKSISVYTDSELLVNQISGDWRIKDEKLKDFAQRARVILKSFDNYEIRHIDREKNREADRLAKRAAENRS